MNSEPQMDTNEHKLLLKKEVFQVVDCAMEVLNTLGHGLLEKPYENALVVEIVVATKTIDRITDLGRGQILNYLKITQLRVGLILNFKRPTLEWERLVL